MFETLRLIVQGNMKRKRNNGGEIIVIGLAIAAPSYSEQQLTR